MTSQGQSQEEQGRPQTQERQGPPIPGRPEHYAISRIQVRPGIWCWMVMFRRVGRAYYKSFYDVRRGGAEKALAAAIVWRDEQLRTVKALSMREFCQIKRTTNRSGAPGVLLIWPKNQPLGAWQARFRLPDGRTVAKTFSVQKYGAARAFALASEARMQLLERVEDKPFLHHPEALHGEAIRERI